MKKITLLLAVLFLISCNKNGDWKQISIDEFDCSFTFPSEDYKIVKDTLTAEIYGKTYMFTANNQLKNMDNPVVYTFMHFDYPNYDLENKVDEYCNDIVNRMKREFYAELMNSETLSDPYPGIKASFHVEANNIYIHVQYVIYNGTVYGLQVVSSVPTQPDFPINEFFDSLKIAKN